ncbi:biotin carboxyl carrier protein of acetyl-CoA carboxylase [Liquorilactobacillus aquaticus DSM 21051]|uniref:Biotin carboxyl carrier protein of acetyl-CoA carboxylase n=1 Tax=Liquorilactobacillus aquaticus DSM 21051 TaxID=1423725 RepID=A0A0R2D6C1_9LACO|nr:acetyl-CoA carboxylase biotin carboxyl carrier protein [Liquorilactobacillus aquaticus]KRM95788.1 biotin carboxyl carrier protein of acetyl-CoA carboxylase [Liquorilactobacillus aquaticus DSM 21051]
MDYKEIQKLIADFNDSPSRELEITTGDFHIRLSKNKVSQPIVQAQASVPSAENRTKNENTPVLPVEGNKAEKPGKTIDSPMVGSVYLQSEPTKPPFVKAGDQIRKGDVVCIIEAMKMMTEIKSEVAGVISKVLVNNEELVEFGQPLFEIEEA